MKRIVFVIAIITTIISNAFAYDMGKFEKVSVTKYGDDVEIITIKFHFEDPMNLTTIAEKMTCEAWKKSLFEKYNKEYLMEFKCENLSVKVGQIEDCDQGGCFKFDTYRNSGAKGTAKFIQVTR